MKIQLKRAYEQPSPDDGVRILVERLWPRGLTKEKAAVDAWLKDIAPSPELRKWYSHELSRWEAFQERYQDELQQNTQALKELKELLKNKKVTFIYAAKDEEHNSARVLKEFVEQK